MTETELDILDTWLDGELGPIEAGELQQRLAANPELLAAQADLRRERELRAAHFAASEPTDAENHDFLNRVEANIARRRRWTLYHQFARTAGAIAACVAIGFGIGWIGRGGPSSTANRTAPAPVYQVNISDESGRVLGVQPFSSPDQAREFSDDLRRWQDQQDQIRNGYLIVRSGNF
ncbi:MAG: anti-sigma factor family protein [Tepidisphaerales bacterium]